MQQKGPLRWSEEGVLGDFAATHQPVSEDASHLFIDKVLFAHIVILDLELALQFAEVSIHIVDIGGHKKRIVDVPAIDIVDSSLHVNTIVILGLGSVGLRHGSASEHDRLLVLDTLVLFSNCIGNITKGTSLVRDRLGTGLLHATHGVSPISCADIVHHCRYFDAVVGCIVLASQHPPPDRKKIGDKISTTIFANGYFCPRSLFPLFVNMFIILY